MLLNVLGKGLAERCGVIVTKSNKAYGEILFDGVMGGVDTRFRNWSGGPPCRYSVGVGLLDQQPASPQCIPSLIRVPDECRVHN